MGFGIPSLNDVPQMLEAFLPIAQAAGGEEILPLMGRLKKIHEGIDPTAPGALKTLQGRVREIIPSAVSILERILTAPEAVPYIEMVATVMNTFGPQILGAQPIDPSQTGPWGAIIVAVVKKNVAFRHKIAQSKACLPSTMEELEVVLRLYQSLAQFNAEVLQGVEEEAKKKTLSRDEIEALEGGRRGNNTIQSITASFTSFVGEERMRSASTSAADGAGLQPFDFAAFIDFQDISEQLRKPSEEANKQATEILALGDPLEAPKEKRREPDMGELSQEIEKAFTAAEAFYDSPQAFELMRQHRTLNMRLMASFFSPDEQQLKELPKEVMEHYFFRKAMQSLSLLSEEAQVEAVTDEFYMSMLQFSATTLIPEIMRAMKPCALRLFREHITLSRPLAGTEFLKKFLAFYKDIKPESEIGQRYADFWTKLADTLK